jgi:hypothetical protein
MKFQAPNGENPKKSEIRNEENSKKNLRFGILNLEFFGIWYLGFRIFAV